MTGDTSLQGLSACVPQFGVIFIKMSPAEPTDVPLLQEHHSVVCIWGINLEDTFLIIHG